MSDSPAAAASAPDAVFSADDDLPTLWIKAYQGEVSGELLFTGLAERADNLSHRQKLNVLALLERRSREALVPVMERSGLQTQTRRTGIPLPQFGSIKALLEYHQ